MKKYASFMMIIMAMTARSAYADYDVTYYPPDPYFQYTYCYPPTASQTNYNEFRTYHRGRHHRHSSYSISVYYAVPHATSSSCVTWVPAHCTCYGECIPGHWEAYRYQTYTQPTHTRYDVKGERSRYTSYRFERAEHYVNYDTSTADDMDSGF
jgi:hypothetical protein